MENLNLGRKNSELIQNQTQKETNDQGAQWPNQSEGETLMSNNSELMTNPDGKGLLILNYGNKELYNDGYASSGEENDELSGMQDIWSSLNPESQEQHTISQPQHHFQHQHSQKQTPNLYQDSRPVQQPYQHPQNYPYQFHQQQQHQQIFYSEQCASMNNYQKQPSQHSQRYGHSQPEFYDYEKEFNQQIYWKGEKKPRVNLYQPKQVLDAMHSKNRKPHSIQIQTDSTFDQSAQNSNSFITPKSTSFNSGVFNSANSDKYHQSNKLNNSHMNGYHQQNIYVYSQSQNRSQNNSQTYQNSMDHSITSSPHDKKGNHLKKQMRTDCPSYEFNQISEESSVSQQFASTLNPQASRLTAQHQYFHQQQQFSSQVPIQQLRQHQLQSQQPIQLQPQQQQQRQQLLFQQNPIDQGHNEAKSQNSLDYFNYETQSVDQENQPNNFQENPNDDSSELVHEKGARKRKRISKEEERNFEIIPSQILQDGRTTIMIRNIPNKYHKQLLLEKIDEFHKDQYDFFYLPIDFKNKCNVGYAFINFIDCSYIPQFYQNFHEKRWEKFNSEKIGLLRYGRIQGRDKLYQHFEYSSVIHQKDKKLKPFIITIGQERKNFELMINRQKQGK